METTAGSARLKERIAEWRRQGLSVGFVPTMGFLHEGHLELVRRSVEEADRTVVSIFVNPTQFGPREDFGTYPRDEAGDLEKLRRAGTDLVFLPDVEEIYPPGFSTFVEVGRLTDGLCGVCRPGHFRGVTTVVSRLFLLVTPDLAFFGEKDFQQLTVIRRMVRDLGFGVRVVGVPTVREEDGLAMSSRNVRLGAEERGQAVLLNRSLKAASELFAEGERSPRALLARVREVLAGADLGAVEYAELRDSVDLLPVNRRQANPDDRIFLAVRFGEVRLIDNSSLSG